MGNNRYLKPIYPALAALIMLFLPIMESEAQHESDRDPFQFGPAHSSQVAYAPVEGVDGAVLQMILITDRYRIAIFNGRRYQKGDSIGQYTITGIELGKVTVENGEDKKIFIPHRE